MFGEAKREVITEVAVPGSTVQLASMSYPPGGSIVTHLSDLIFRWRLTPALSHVQSWYGVWQPQKTGQLALFPPEVDAGSVADASGENTRCVVLSVDLPWLEDVTGMNRTSIEPACSSMLNLENTHIEYAMRRISSALTSSTPMRRLLIEANALSIAADVALVLRDPPERQPDRAVGRSIVRKVQDFVHANLQHDVTIRRLAEEAGVSYGYARSSFKAATGQSIPDYIAEVRISRAKDLLQTRAVPLKQVAFLLGYCSHSAFSAAFRKATGVSPSAFRDASL